MLADAPEVVQLIPDGIDASGCPVGTEKREVGPQVPPANSTSILTNSSSLDC
jgi:hypothetical protein